MLKMALPTVLVLVLIALFNGGNAANNGTALLNGGNTEENGSCNGTLVSLSVKVEVLQRSLTSEFTRTIKTTSTESFRNDYKKIAGSLEVGFKVFFGVSAKASFDHVTKQVQKSKNASHVDNQDKKTYNQDLTQIYRKITTSVTINGSMASTEETTWVNTAPTNNPPGQEQLDQQAANYLKKNYCDMNSGGQATGNTYTQERCLVTTYACYNTTNTTITTNSTTSVPPNSGTEKQKCETAGTGNVYNPGDNQNTPGCAKCHCCKPTGTKSLPLKGNPGKGNTCTMNGVSTNVGGKMIWLFVCTKFLINKF